MLSVRYRSFFFVCGLSCLALPAMVWGQTNIVNGNLFNLTNTSNAPNGVWSWFQDERAIVDWSDPNNPNVVYMSSNIDPRTDTATDKYELYKGFTNDFGKKWNWTAITENSTMDNLRPVVPKWNGQNTAVTWLRGTYSTYVNWNTDDN